MLGETMFSQPVMKRYKIVHEEYYQFIQTNAHIALKWQRVLETAGP
jgi:hypothetical protein